MGGLHTADDQLTSGCQQHAALTGGTSCGAMPAADMGGQLLSLRMWAGLIFLSDLHQAHQSLSSPARCSAGTACPRS